MQAPAAQTWKRGTRTSAQGAACADGAEGGKRGAAKATAALLTADDEGVDAQLHTFARGAEPLLHRLRYGFRLSDVRRQWSGSVIILYPCAF